MTFTEAAAELGLSPEEITPEAIQRRYRDQVKTCHPDKVNTPEAVAQFKRVTEAFERLSQPDEGPAEGPKVPATIDEAVQEFCFVAHFSQGDVWRSLSPLEKLRSLFGFYLAPLGVPFIPQNTPLVMRTFRKSGNGRHVPLLVAPVDCEYVDDMKQDDEFLLLLRPVEKACVRERLERSVASGLTVEQACLKLSKELTDASRAPLFAPQASKGGAA